MNRIDRFYGFIAVLETPFSEWVQRLNIKGDYYGLPYSGKL